jgi:hypothetical protein
MLDIFIFFLPSFKINSFAMCVVCLTIASAVAVSLAVTGCMGKPSKQENKPAEIGALSQMELPNWVVNPYSELPSGVIAGVGISKKPAENEQLRFLIIQAEAQARAEIATTLQTEISRLTKDAMQSASIDAMTAVETSFATVTSEVVKNVPLSGAVRDKIFQDKNGVIYVRIVINSAVVKNYLEDSISNYSEAMQKAGATRDQIKKTNASMKHLFDELDLKTVQRGEKPE